MVISSPNEQPDFNELDDLYVCSPETYEQVTDWIDVQSLSSDGVIYPPHEDECFIDDPRIIYPEPWKLSQLLSLIDHKNVDVRLHDKAIMVKYGITVLLFTWDDLYVDI
jgi:hypothetical protein